MFLSDFFIKDFLLNIFMIAQIIPLNINYRYEFS